jgi:molybdenum cofactor biosynthesis enzyme MoaA
MFLLNSCDGKYRDSLDVRFTKACNNNCSFCIEKQGIIGQQTNVQELIKSTKIAQQEYQKDTILILGGEPLLKIKEVLEYIKGIRNFVKEIYLTTSLPYTIIEHWQIFEEIVYLLNGLNISLQHYDYNINNQILNATNKFNRIELIRKICSNEEFANKCRVSINLVKGAIDNKKDLDKFLSTMEELNIKHVKINELQHCSDLYVSFEEIYGLKLKSPYSNGCQTEIKLKNYNLKITLKRACFLVETSRTATLKDLIKVIIKKLKRKSKNGQLVLYEDGRLSNGWQKA